jgi:hypothetical protein
MKMKFILCPRDDRKETIIIEDTTPHARLISARARNTVLTSLLLDTVPVLREGTAPLPAGAASFIHIVLQHAGGNYSISSVSDLRSP